MFTALFTRRGALRRFASTTIAMVLALVMATGPAVNTTLAAKPAAKMPKTLLPLTITDVVVQSGQLFAVAQLGNEQFLLPINLGTSPNPAVDADCPILDLEINAIHLNLLGLRVDTSDICLAITAHEGEGLLGDLLCAVANLLDQGLSLGDILGGLTNAQLETLLTGIADLLDDVFAMATEPDSLVGVSGTTAGACDVLNLALGPIDLNLLGLQVYLDDCAGGPVTVDITAVPGEGLLGDLLAGLLCDLDDLLNGGGGGGALAGLLNDILAVIQDILALA
jgi:hypothetical protein